MRAYLAAPLFSEAERQFNLVIAAELERHLEVFVPQRDGVMLVDAVRFGMSPDKAKKLVFDTDVDAIRRADIVVAILDGRAVDEGVAVELGIAWAIGRYSVALKTDFRSLAWFGDNPMVESVLGRVFSSLKELATFVSYYVSIGGSVAAKGDGRSQG